MQIEISTRHGHLSEASQDKIRAKLEKLGRIFERLTSITITIDLNDSSKPSVDLKVEAEHKHDFVSHDQSETLKGTIDNAIRKMEQQLRKYKERIQDHHR